MTDEKQLVPHLELVMLVDDDPFMLGLLADMLLESGVKEVLQQLDARSALQALSMRRPALMICDLRMPDMDGIEFLDKVARLGYSGSVLLHSGVDAGVIRAAERLATAHGLNVIGAFAKPVSRKSLLDSILSISTP